MLMDSHCGQQQLASLQHTIICLCKSHFLSSRYFNLFIISKETDIFTFNFIGDLIMSLYLSISTLTFIPWFSFLFVHVIVWRQFLLQTAVITAATTNNNNRSSSRSLNNNIHQQQEHAATIITTEAETTYISNNNNNRSSNNNNMHQKQQHASETATCIRNSNNNNKR